MRPTELNVLPLSETRTDPIPILIVDDSAANLTALEAALSRPEYQIVLASSAEQAIERFKQFEFAVALLDVRLPGMDGYDLARMIRQMELQHRTPIIFVTGGSCNRPEVAHGYRLGAVDFLQKPVDIDALLAKVGLFAELYRKKMDLQRSGSRLQRELSERSRLERLRIEEQRRVARLEQAQEKQKTLENERANFHNLFMQTPEMVCILKGPNHVFEFVNEAHIKALGFDATGLSMREAQPESVEVHGILDEVYRTGKTAELHEIPVTVTDRLRYFNLTYSARRDESGQINGIMVLGIEVTDGVLGRQKLDNALTIRDEFISIASHELRTPLASLKLRMQRLQWQISREMPEAFAPENVKELADSCNRQINALAKLTNDMFDVSRIEAGKLNMEFEECDFAVISREAIGALNDQFHDSKIQLSVSLADRAPINADRQRMNQVVLNLLTNTLKYGEQQPVHVSLETSDGYAVLKVRDHGIGIAPENIARIFNRFERAIGTINISGLGLGLYITKQIVDRHGGTISVESRPGAGSIFEVKIPLLH